MEARLVLCPAHWCIRAKVVSYTVDQGWAIISADGPHVGRPSPSRAELLDEQKRAQ